MSAKYIFYDVVEDFYSTAVTDVILSDSRLWLRIQKRSLIVISKTVFVCRKSICAITYCNHSYYNDLLLIVYMLIWSRNDTDLCSKSIKIGNRNYKVIIPDNIQCD
ncbi:MAG: hypothetical protein L6V93_05260 [Clostridiales bacterium]|nr:MAG: hypothetical protein L6V93_05260 [Clostridiales bacterium]